MGHVQALWATNDEPAVRPYASGFAPEADGGYRDPYGLVAYQAANYTLAKVLGEDRLGLAVTVLGLAGLALVALSPLLGFGYMGGLE